MNDKACPQKWHGIPNALFIVTYFDSLGTNFYLKIACYKGTCFNVQVSIVPFSEEAILMLSGSRKAAVKKIFPMILKIIK
jgi:hypothetical protein